MNWHLQSPQRRWFMFDSSCNTNICIRIIFKQSYNLPSVPSCPVTTPDSHTKSIMVFTCIIGAVHHDIDLKFCFIMIAINMINVSPLVMSSSINHLGEPDASKHLCNLIISFRKPSRVMFDPWPELNKRIKRQISCQQATDCWVLTNMDVRDFSIVSFIRLQEWRLWPFFENLQHIEPLWV